MKHFDLQTTMQKMLEGGISPDEHAWLEREMLENPEAVGLWLKLCDVHSALEVRFESEAQIKISPVVPVERVLVRQHKRVVKFSLIATAAILVVSAAVMWMKMMATPPATLAEFAVAPGTSFTLTHSEVEGKDAPVGQVLSEGSRLRLMSGTMEATFLSGVRCVIEGPCDLTVVKDRQVKVSSGLAWFHVPPKATGFMVKTPQLAVTDLGTEFGVVVLSSGGDEVHVTKGAVEIRSLLQGRNEEILELNTGEARRLDESGRFEEVVVQPGRFTTKLPEGPPVLAGELGILDLKAREGINPATGRPWKAGDTYRLIFATRKERDARARSIEEYNDFVQKAANSSRLNLKGAEWKVFGSTATVSAKENTGLVDRVSAGEAVFLVNGETLVVDRSGKLLNDSIEHPINRDENFRLLGGSRNIATGTSQIGGSSNGVFSFGDEDDGESRVTVGSSDETRRWKYVYNRPSTATYSFYALSEKLMVLKR